MAAMGSIKALLSRERRVKVGGKVVQAMNLKTTLMTGECASTVDGRMWRIKDIHHDLRSVDAGLLSQYYTEADIKALAADTGTIALVLVLPFEELGAFDGAGGFRKARGMRHVRQLDEPRYLPAENFTGIITVVHAHDVEFGDLGYTSAMADVALVTDGDHNDFSMFPETGDGAISRHDMYLTYASATRKQFDARVRLREYIIDMIRGNQSVTDTCSMVLGPDSWQLMNLLLPREPRTRRKDDVASVWEYVSTTGTYGILSKHLEDRERIELKFHTHAELKRLEGVVGAGFDINLSSTALENGVRRQQMPGGITPDRVSVPESHMMNLIRNIPGLGPDQKAKRKPVGVCLVYDEATTSLDIQISFVKVPARIAFAPPATRSPAPAPAPATLQPTTEPEDSWPEVWRRLQSDGWTWKAGTGIISWYYIRPNCDVRTGTHLQDYFHSPEEVLAYESPTATSTAAASGRPPRGTKRARPPGDV